MYAKWELDWTGEPLSRYLTFCGMIHILKRVLIQIAHWLQNYSYLSVNIGTKITLEK